MSKVYHYCIYLGRFPYIFSVCLLNLLHIFHTLCSPPHRCSLSCFSIVTTAAFLNRTGFVFGKTWEKLKEQLSACPFSGLESQLCGGKKRLREFGLKRPLPSLPGLAGSHSKGNCLHTHDPHCHREVILRDHLLPPHFSNKILSLIFFFSFLWEGGRPIQIALYLCFCLC